MFRKKEIALCIFCIVLFISVCVSANAENKEKEGIQVRTINYDDIPWEESVGDFTNKLNISPETVLKLSELYLLEIHPEMIENKSPTIQMIKDSDIYVISYGTIPIQAGGDINIAIHSRTGEVLKMWAGE